MSNELGEGLWLIGHKNCVQFRFLVFVGSNSKVIKIGVLDDNKQEARMADDDDHLILESWMLNDRLLADLEMESPIIVSNVTNKMAMGYIKL